MGTETNISNKERHADDVEKMGPLRGDGNFSKVHLPQKPFRVEKMGPLRGDGNYNILHVHHIRRHS